MKIFIDDLRMKPERYDIKFESGEELLKWIEEHPTTNIDLLSLDHDLNEGFMNGTKLCKELASINELQLEEIQFHSDNYQGLKQMYSIVKSAHSSGCFSNLKNINPYKINVINGEEDEFRFFDMRR